MKARQRQGKAAGAGGVKLKVVGGFDPDRGRQRSFPFHLSLAGVDVRPLQAFEFPVDPSASRRVLRVEVWPGIWGGLKLNVPGAAPYALRLFLDPG